MPSSDCACQSENKLIDGRNDWSSGTERVLSVDPKLNRKRKRRGARDNRTSGKTNFWWRNQLNALIRKVRKDLKGSGGWGNYESS